MREVRLVCICRDSVRLLTGELGAFETLHFSLVTKASVSARVVYITVHGAHDIVRFTANGFRCRSSCEADALCCSRAVTYTVQHDPHGGERPVAPQLLAAQRAARSDSVRRPDAGVQLARRQTLQV